MPRGPYDKSLLGLAECLTNENLFKKGESYTLNYVKEKCGKHFRTVESYINNSENLELLNMELVRLTKGTRKIKPTTILKTIRGIYVDPPEEDPISTILSRIELEIFSEPDGWELFDCIVTVHLKETPSLKAIDKGVEGFSTYLKPTTTLQLRVKE